MPSQLIPYCQYTVDAVIGTLVKVYDFQQIGQKGYYGASLELSPDCLVTPYLIETWAVLIQAGFLRGHHIFHEKVSLPGSKKFDSRQMITRIYLYLQNITGVASPKPCHVKPAIRYYFKRTGKCLFGRASCDRIRPP
ncbi:MAG: hypothetical protein RBR67_17750 [Desulfobacterium sp.]|nr:hypothetical protein [Desulfobacterium sp.]